MKLFDLHCDTLSEMYFGNVPLAKNELNISLDKTEKYEKYAQLFAIYSTQRLPDEENWERFHKILAHGRPELVSDGRFTPYLAIEGGKLLAGKIERLDEVYNLGVRFLTLVWGSTCCLGGAHDTDEGLTEFGRQVVERCFTLGIVPDLSHASDPLFWDTIEMARAAGKPVIASHSNSRAIRDHKRNLTDDMFTAIRDLGGIVGLSMYRLHLWHNDNECDIDTVVKHIEHDLSLGGQDMLCMGGDLDGIANEGPRGIETVADIEKIADRLAQLNYSQTLIDKIMYDNAAAFMERNGISSL